MTFPPPRISTHYTANLPGIPETSHTREKWKQREEGNSQDLTHQALHPQGKQQKQGAQKSQGSGSRAAAARCGQAGAGSPPGGVRRQERVVSLWCSHPGFLQLCILLPCPPTQRAQEPPSSTVKPRSSQAMAAHSAEHCKNSDSYAVPKGQHAAL